MELATDIIEWLQSLPPGSSVGVDDSGLALEADTGFDWYEIGGVPDTEYTLDDKL
jgi:hypothetical protein